MHSKPRKENFLFEQLRYKEIEVFNPLFILPSVNHRQVTCKPYFPGYLFVHVDIELIGLSNLKWFPGAVGVVCFGGEPAYLPDGIIVMLQKKMNHQNAFVFEPGARFKKGAPVRITQGPLEGYRGIFDEYLPGKERARILLNTLMDRAFPAEISIHNLAD